MTDMNRNDESIVAKPNVLSLGTVTTGALGSAANMRPGVRAYAIKSYVAAFASFVILTSMIPVPSAHALIQGGPSFTQIATESSAAAENTGWNKSIHSIAFDGNTLIPGYGDWGANSDSNGSVAARVGIEPLDLLTNTWLPKSPLLGSQAITNIREISGKLYIPSTDPSSHGSGGYATNASGTWVVNAPASLAAATHIFDVASLGTNDLWLSGAIDLNGGAGSQATVWHSTDAGTTWSVVMSQDSSQTDGYLRYYWIVAYNGRIYVQATPGNWQQQNSYPVRSTDGVTWATTTVTPTSVGAQDSGVCGYNAGDSTAAPIVFDGEMVCGSTWGSNWYLSTYDGTTLQRLNPFNQAEGARGLWVDGSTLYALVAGGSSGATTAIYATQDLSHWHPVANLSGVLGSGHNFTAMGIYNGSIYLGDDQAGIWKSTTTMAQSPAAAVPSFSTPVTINNRFAMNSGTHTVQPYGCSNVDADAMFSIGGIIATNTWVANSSHAGTSCTTSASGAASITFATSALQPGTYTIQVKNDDGTTGSAGTITIYDPNAKPLITGVTHSIDPSTGDVLLQIADQNFAAPNDASTFNPFSVWLAAATQQKSFVALDGAPLKACLSQDVYDFLQGLDPSYVQQMSVEVPCYDIGTYDPVHGSFAPAMTATNLVIRLPAGTDVSRGTVQWLGDGGATLLASQVYTFADPVWTTDPKQAGTPIYGGPLADTGVDMNRYALFGALLIVVALSIVLTLRGPGSARRLKR